MKKGIFTVMVLLVMVAMSPVAFAAYEDIQVVPTISDSYAYGTVGAQMYYNSKGVWVKQVKLYNGTPTPGYDNPVWGVAEGMTYENTTSASSNTRFPRPHIFAADTNGSPPPLDFKIQGSANAIAFFQSIIGASATIDTETTAPIMIGAIEYVLVWSRTGRVFAFTLDSSQAVAIRGIVASDLF